MAFWGPGFFEAPSSRTNTFSAATGCAAVMGRSVGNVPAALTFLPSSVYWIPSQEKGLEIGFRKHGRVSGNTTAGPVVEVMCEPTGFGVSVLHRLYFLLQWYCIC